MLHFISQSLSKIKYNKKQAWPYLHVCVYLCEWMCFLSNTCTSVEHVSTLYVLIYQLFKLYGKFVSGQFVRAGISTYAVSFSITCYQLQVIILALCSIFFLVAFVYKCWCLEYSIFGHKCFFFSTFYFCSRIPQDS